MAISAMPITYHEKGMVREGCEGEENNDGILVVTSGAKRLPAGPGLEADREAER